MKNKRFWTPEKIELLKAFSSNPTLTKSDIAKKLKTSLDAVHHAQRRYNIKHEYQKEQKINEDIFFDKPKKVALTKQQVDELCSVIGKKIYNSFEYIKLDEPKSKINKNKNKKEEISVLDISDVHMGMINEIYDEEAGKRITTYNHEIFLKQLNNLRQSIYECHQIQSYTFNLKKLVIFVLGDIITNDRIFPEQTFEIEKCVGLQIWDAISIWSKFFNDLLSIYQEVEVVCMVGNHGRSNPTHYNEPVQNNFEYFIYKSWQKQFENSKRIKIIVPDTGRYTHKVGKWKHLVEHGHELKGYSENAIKNQLKELFVNMGQFDVMHFGHLHQLADKRISDKVLVKQNGCWILKDSYAFNKFKTYSIPEQHFFGCNDKRKETWKYCLDLRC